MRLINFGPGEIADRLSILALKIQYGKDAGKSIDHFERERNALIAQFRPGPSNRCIEHVLELAAVNAMIWTDTDRVRHLRTLYDVRSTDQMLIRGELANLAIRMQECNDRRAQLITIINCNSGNGSEEEKL